MDEAEAIRRIDASRSAVLGSIRPDGSPHLVPVVFARLGDRYVTAVDHKRKATRRLARLENLRADPRCTLLFEHYSDDWHALWWVRVDGRATVTDRPDPPLEAALVDRYPQYRSRPPAGPYIVLTAQRVTGWSA